MSGWPSLSITNVHKNGLKQHSFFCQNGWYYKAGITVTVSKEGEKEMTGIFVFKIILQTWIKS
jgi:hypothetical protein